MIFYSFKNFDNFSLQTCGFSISNKFNGCFRVFLLLFFGLFFTKQHSPRKNVWIFLFSKSFKENDTESHALIQLLTQINTTNKLKTTGFDKSCNGINEKQQLMEELLPLTLYKLSTYITKLIICIRRLLLFRKIWKGEKKRVSKKLLTWNGKYFVKKKIVDDFFYTSVFKSSNQLFIFLFLKKLWQIRKHEKNQKNVWNYFLFVNLNSL